jgi:hypothetical protein
VLGACCSAQRQKYISTRIYLPCQTLSECMFFTDRLHLLRRPGQRSSTPFFPLGVSQTFSRILLSRDFGARICLLPDIVAGSPNKSEVVKCTSARPAAALLGDPHSDFYVSHIQVHWPPMHYVEDS